MSDYVGPFIRAGYHVKMVPLPKKGCPKCKKGILGGLTFCGRCGTPVGKYMAECLEESVDYFKLQDEIKEALTGSTESLESVDLKDPSYIYTPNVRRSPPRVFYPEDMPDCFADLKDRDSEILWLESSFAEEIEILKEHYDTVEVMWGIVRTTK